jgi:hypothetical protein
MFFHKARDQISHQLKIANKIVQWNAKFIPLSQAIYFYVRDECQSLHHIQETVLMICQLPLCTVFTVKGI